MFDGPQKLYKRTHKEGNETWTESHLPNEGHHEIDFDSPLVPVERDSFPRLAGLSNTIDLEAYH